MSERILEVRDLHFYYGEIHALKGISLEVNDGEIVTLIGANGAGKTTTLRSIWATLPAAKSAFWASVSTTRRATPLPPRASPSAWRAGMYLPT